MLPCRAMPGVNQTLNRRVPLRDAHFDERISSVFFTSDKSRNNLQRTSRCFIEATRISKVKRRERKRDQSIAPRPIHPSPPHARRGRVAGSFEGARRARMGRQVERAESTGATMNARHLSRGIGVTVKYRAVRPAQRKGEKGRSARRVQVKCRIILAVRIATAGAQERDRRDRGGRWEGAAANGRWRLAREEINRRIKRRIRTTREATSGACTCRSRGSVARHVRVHLIFFFFFLWDHVSYPVCLFS